jgi:hypothetical protein
MTESTGPDAAPWFSDAADAGRYIREVGRLWFFWLLGLGLLAMTRGIAAVVAGVALLIAMFLLMQPLQQRVQARFGAAESRKIVFGESLSARDKALRQLTYGRRPFAEAVAVRGLWPALALLPWVVIVATLVAAAVVATVFLGS